MPAKRDFLTWLTKFAFRHAPPATFEPTTVIHLTTITPGNMALIERAGHAAQLGHPLHMNGAMYVVTRIGWDSTHNRYPVIELKELI